MSDEKNRPQARSRRHSHAARGNEGDGDIKNTNQEEKGLGLHEIPIGQECHAQLLLSDATDTPLSLALDKRASAQIDRKMAQIARLTSQRSLGQSE